MSLPIASSQVPGHLIEGILNFRNFRVKFHLDTRKGLDEEQENCESFLDTFKMPRILLGTRLADVICGR